MFMFGMGLPSLKTPLFMMTSVLIRGSAATCSACSAVVRAAAIAEDIEAELPRAELAQVGRTIDDVVGQGRHFFLDCGLRPGPRCVGDGGLPGTEGLHRRGLFTRRSRRLSRR